jgi:hypothetical protein
MIRQPSTAASLYAWWNAAVADPGTPRHDGLPECGFYRLQHVKGAPYVPVRVFVVREIDDIGVRRGGAQRVGRHLPERGDLGILRVEVFQCGTSVGLALHLADVSLDELRLRSRLCARARHDPPRNTPWSCAF